MDQVPTPKSPGEVAAVAAPETSVNGTILVAAISVGVMVFARLFMGIMAFSGGGASLVGVLLPVALAVLILAGIVAGQRLAWQWGRLLGLLGGILLTLTAIGVLGRAREHPVFIMAGVLLLLQGLPLFPMFFALGTQSAREHFRLTCPQCGSRKPKAADFLFRRAVCRECKTVWD